MPKIFLYMLTLSVMVVSCKKDRTDNVIYDKEISYDVILVIGQSNTHQGLGYSSILDAPSGLVKQLGRYDPYDLKIIPASEPLDHFTKFNGHVGFAMTFAKKYSQEFLQQDHEVLIIPASMGSTGFASNHWNKGDILYTDAVNRTNYILNNFKSKLAAILWHQGENDVNNSNYQANLDSMIVNIRKDMTGTDTNVPFILGGMVPYWMDQDNNVLYTNNIISDTPNRINKTGYADPKIPFVITKPDNSIIPIHFDGNGQREMGQRYFNEYKRLVN